MKRTTRLWFDLLAVSVFLSWQNVASAPYEAINNLVRLQVLSPSLVRLEVRGPVGWENRPSFHIVERTWGGAAVTRTENDSVAFYTCANFVVNVPKTAVDLQNVTITKTDNSLLWSLAQNNQIPTRILCRWTDYGLSYLYDDGAGQVRYGSAGIGDQYYWIFEKNGSYYRIRNKSTGSYMNIEGLTGRVQCGAIQPAWLSAQWSFVSVDPYVRLQNRWKTDSYIHMEHHNGFAECDNTVLDTWWSAQWSMPDASLTGDANRALIPNPVSSPMAFAVFDVPRIIPPAWGYNVAPNGSSFPEHNGWDTTNYSQDVYVFLPNGDGRLLRSDFVRLTGKTELVPLYGLGVWNSRWYAYTQAEALAKIDRYRSSGLPLDVLVIDTDWRVGGSSGYDVNTTLFPTMAAFFPDAHSRNAKIVFNDHPEPQASSALSPVEVVFRNNGLRGKLALGLDFWWFDRNWSTCIIPPAGLNKEVFGMYLYQWVAADYAPGLRPFIMANADGVDNGIWNRSPDFAAHRYTCQWTGDIAPDYASLQREVSNAVHYGVHGPFAYVSADLGGHVSDPTTNQFCRWLEYGALSPFFRPHCTKNLSRDPWDWPAPVEAVQRDFTLMRMRLLPVFYNAARLNYDTGEPIVRRCDQDYPAYAQAAAEDQYLIGSKILVAPVMADVTSRTVWVPPGNWINTWTGTRLAGPQTAAVAASLQQIPLLVKEGAVLPLAPAMQYTTERSWNPITLDVYPAASGSDTGSLYEDDLVGVGYKTGAFRRTPVTTASSSVAKTVTIVVGAAGGTYTGALTQRGWQLRVRSPQGWPDSAVGVTLDGQALAYRVRARDAAAMPFQTDSGAADGRVLTATLPAKAVSSSQTVIIYYDRSTAAGRFNALERPAIACFANRGRIMVRPSGIIGTAAIKCTVYDLRGRALWSTCARIGAHQREWRAGTMTTAGTYLYRIEMRSGGQVFSMNGLLYISTKNSR